MRRRTLARFLDHPLFKMLMMPTRRGLQVLNVAAQPVLRTIGRVVGGDVLADAVAFFQAFDGMETGFRERADDVIELLHGDDHAVRAGGIAAGRHHRGGPVLRRATGREGLGVGAVIVNRCTPTFGEPTGRRPRGAQTAPRLYDNLVELRPPLATERARRTSPR